MDICIPSAFTRKVCVLIIGLLCCLKVTLCFIKPVFQCTHKRVHTLSHILIQDEETAKCYSGYLCGGELTGKFHFCSFMSFTFSIMNCITCIIFLFKKKVFKKLIHTLLLIPKD